MLLRCSGGRMVVHCLLITLLILGLRHRNSKSSTKSQDTHGRLCRLWCGYKLSLASFALEFTYHWHLRRIMFNSATGILINLSTLAIGNLIKFYNIFPPCCGFSLFALFFFWVWGLFAFGHLFVSAFAIICFALGSKDGDLRTLPTI